MSVHAIDGNAGERGVGSYRGASRRWRAVLERDAGADGRFWYSVATTGVYCRPSCGARRPRRENVDFHDSPAAAEAAGFRPCGRCRPEAGADPRGRAAMVEKACRFMEAAESPPALATVAAHVGLSPHHFHRLFREATGLTPRAWAAGLRARTARQRLQSGASVTEALHEAGYGASSRFYAAAPARLGMQPATLRRGARGEQVRYAVARCTLGLVLVAATAKGVCAIHLGDTEDELLRLLERDFPEASRDTGDAAFGAWADAAVALADGDAAQAARLPLDIRGTAFQLRVWEALRRIPPGETASYTRVAEAIGAPAAVRAVAGACAANRLAIAIPCHRVLRADGSTSGYRWGPGRKKALLQREGGR